MKNVFNIKRIKDKKGIGMTDTLVAVLIIALFTGVITTLLYNIYISNSSIKRMSQATEYITKVFEYSEKEYYDNVSKESLTSYFNTNFNLEDAYAEDEN